MKQNLLLCLFFIGSISFADAQCTSYFADDFEDMDLAGWANIEDWANDGGELKHNPPATTSSIDYISTSTGTNQNDLTSDNYSWEFCLRNGAWDPSGSNAFWFYIGANEANLLSGTVNGYAVGVNMTGTSDLLTLYSVNNGSPTSVITSTFDWGSSGDHCIKVTRTAAGLWELFVNGTSEGTANNTDYTANLEHVGLVFEFTSGRAGQLWLDDVNISKGPDCAVAAPCSFSNISATSSCSGDNAIFTVSYTATSTSGIHEVDINGHGFQTVANGETYLMTGPTTAATGVTITVRDDADNTCSATGTTDIPECPVVSGVICGSYTTGGVYITELSYNPPTTQGNDSDCEYVEIFNAYANTVDLEGWSFSGITYTFPAGTMIASGAYLVVAISGGDGTCMDYDISTASHFFTGALSNSGETITLSDNCSSSGFTSSVTYTNGAANGTGDAMYYLADGSSTTDIPTPGTGNCDPSTEERNDLIVTASSAGCETNTGGPANDTYAADITFEQSFVPTAATYTVSSGGVGTIVMNTEDTNDPNADLAGTIAVTGIPEGTDVTISIAGASCAIEITIPSPSCEACETAGSSASTATVDVTTGAIGSGGDADALDDAFVVAQATSDCVGTQTYQPTYGVLSWDDGTNTGSIAGLETTDGVAYAGTASFQLNEVSNGCAGTGLIGTMIPRNGLISSNSTSMQGNSPKPAGIGSHFTEIVGGFADVNQICIDFSVAIDEVSFFLGDVESSATNPGSIYVYDSNDDLMSSLPIPTATGNEGDCSGSTSGAGFDGCGNDETVFVAISAPAATISKICIEVGDFPDDGSLPAGSEHLSFGGISIGGQCIGTVPVELIDFTARPNAQSILLEWSTASEENNEGFIIEHSENGRDFKKIGQKKGVGTSAIIQSYKYLHESPLMGKNFYRLLQVDFDGAYEYSNVAIAKISGPEQVRLYPSLTTDGHTAIYFQEDIRKEIQLDVFNMVGHQLSSVALAPGTRVFELDASDFEAGVYFVKIPSEDGIRTLKFIKR